MYPVTGRRGPLVIAHRGGGGEYPENSREAFDALRSLGVRHVETDAHLSSDGVVVINHDADLDRTFHAHGQIRQYTWAELSQMEGHGGTQMMSLEQALHDFPDMYFNIDAKTDEVAGPLVDVVRSCGATSRVLIASFSERRLARIRRAVEPLTTSLGTMGVARLLLAAQTHSDAARLGVPGPLQGVRAVQVPEKHGIVRVLDRRFVATAHRAGLAVHVWTVNDEADMHRLIDWGVDGLVTDYPTRARAVLEERGQWHEVPAPSVSSPTRLHQLQPGAAYSPAPCGYAPRQAPPGQ